MNPGSFTDRHTPTCPAMPAARGEESERAREIHVSTIKSYWGPTNERTVPLYGVAVCNTTPLHRNKVDLSCFDLMLNANS